MNNFVPCINNSSRIADFYFWIDEEYFTHRFTNNFNISFNSILKH
jgi:hypothetical protein